VVDGISPPERVGDDEKRVVVDKRQSDMIADAGAIAVEMTAA
jgi:hypothetical protein